MKKLDIRFDTEKVDKDLELIMNKIDKSKSEVARAALNIGLDRLRFYVASEQVTYCSKHIEEFK